MHYDSFTSMKENSFLPNLMKYKKDQQPHKQRTKMAILKNENKEHKKKDVLQSIWYWQLGEKKTKPENQGEPQNWRYETQEKPASFQIKIQIKKFLPV